MTNNKETQVARHFVVLLFVFLLGLSFVGLWFLGSGQRNTSMVEAIPLANGKYVRPTVLGASALSQGTPLHSQLRAKNGANLNSQEGELSESKNARHGDVLVVVNDFLSLQESREATASKSLVEAALIKSGFDVNSKETTTGKTGSRSVTEFSGGSARLIQGIISWSGNSPDKMWIETFSMAYANETFEAEDFKSQLQKSLTSWQLTGVLLPKSDDSGPSDVTLLSDVIQNNQVVIAKYGKDKKHELPNLPQDITVITSQDKIH